MRSAAKVYRNCCCTNRISLLCKQLLNVFYSDIFVSKQVLSETEWACFLGGAKFQEEERKITASPTRQAWHSGHFREDPAWGQGLECHVICLLYPSPSVPSGLRSTYQYKQSRCTFRRNQKSRIAKNVHRNPRPRPEP